MTTPRYYRRLNLLPPRPPPPRRTSISGTEAEIDELRDQYKHLKAKGSYHRRTNGLYKEHLVRDYHKAETAFTKGDFDECQDFCFQIIAAEPLSDTIKAKTYMMLARKEVVPDSASEREYYADQALMSWGVVIGRVGYCHTRFPIEQAREQKRIARELLDDARVDSINRLADEVVRPRARPHEDKENVTPEQEDPEAAAESQEL